MPDGVREGRCEVQCFHPESIADALDDLPDDATLREAASTLKVLGNPNRLKILLALSDRELCVCDLTSVLGQSVSSTSQHLRELRNLGAVDFRPDGKLAYYSIADDYWLKLVRKVCEQCEPAARS